jgi:hypothetical protein
VDVMEMAPHLHILGLNREDAPLWGSITSDNQILKMQKQGNKGSNYLVTASSEVRSAGRRYSLGCFPGC